MRDQLREKKHFDDGIEFLTAAIVQDEADAKNTEGIKPSGQAIFLYGILKNYKSALVMRYSRGDDVHDLRLWFHKLVDAWERMAAYVANNLSKEVAEQYQILTFDNYHSFLWYLSFAVSLQVEDAMLRRVVMLIGNHGQDLFLDTVVEKLGIAKAKATEVRFTRPYQSLYAATNGPQEEKAKLVATFLKNWYSSSKRAYWYGRGENPDNKNYFGNWAFESAMVVRLWNVDDSSFATHPHYPRDMAHWNAVAEPAK